MSDIINTGGPAFPCEVQPDRINEGAHQTGVFTHAQYGMTLRDYFAAKAMQGFASDDCGWLDGVNGMANCAYEWADAMIAARNKGGKS